MQCFGADAVAGGGEEGVAGGVAGVVRCVEHEGLIWLWGSGEPFSIGFEAPRVPGDTGFTVLLEDAPDPDDVPAGGDHPLVRMVCAHCLLEEHPAVAAGLDVARAHGAADLTPNGWVGRRVGVDPAVGV